MRKIEVFALGVVFMLGSCGNAEPSAPSNGLSKEDQMIVNTIMKEEPVVVEPQVTFDQSQLNNDILGLCVKFKTLDGADRTEVFNKFETILPQCPVKLGAKNEVEPEMDNAVQMMSFNDLKELLGEPNEVREDGMIVYNLSADQSYRVLFLPNPSGVICCRFYEGAS